MGVTRIQSISVSSLSAAIEHRLAPGPHEKVVQHFIYSCHPEMRNTIRDIYTYSQNEVDGYTEIFKYVESAQYKKKVRKNSVIQEIVIAYSKEDFNNLSESEIVEKITDDIHIFTDVFEEKFGFRPFITAFVHKNNIGMYHIHILFSLMNPETLKKARWKKRTYFDLIKKMSERSPRIKNTGRTKGIGAYPLWLIRKLEDRYGREIAKEIVKIAREKKYSVRNLIENAEKLLNNRTTEV